MDEGHPVGQGLARGVNHDKLGAILGRLKRRGTSVLVVGDLSDQLAGAMSRRMMGHPDETRYRLLVLLKPTTTPADWFPAPVTPDDEGVEVLDYGGLPRDGTATATGAAGPAAPSAGEAPSVEELGDRIGEWLSTTAEAVDPEPGQFRLGVVSLDALLETADVQRTKAFAAEVRDFMRQYRGCAHLHLPRERSSTEVQQLRVWVDVIVELRTGGGRPEQKWIIPDQVETNWFPLRDHEAHP